MQYASTPESEGVSSLAAQPQLAENSRQGSERKHRTLASGFAPLNSQTTQWSSWQSSSGTASGPTVYLYDGPTLVLEVNDSGSVFARYAPGWNLDEPLSESLLGSTSYYAMDGLGSVTSLSDSASTLADSYTYDSFGKLVTSSGTLINRFQYAAREFDAETGLYQNRARYYDPGTGRFISEDPIAFGGGMNFYDYVRNNPVVLVDPTGLESRGGYGLRPPNPNINTHVCDGHGGQVPQMGGKFPSPMQKKCLFDCMVRHEITHIIDSTIAVPTICVGQPAGTVIGSSGLTHDTNEVNASNAEIDCLSKKLDTPCGGGPCRDIIFNRILQMQDFRDKRPPYENR